MSRQGAKAEMKTTKQEASTLEPLARTESNKLLTLAYRNSRRRATDQPAKSLQQSLERKLPSPCPALRDVLDRSVCSPDIAAGYPSDSLSPQLKPSLTTSLKALDLDSDRKRKRIDSPVSTEYLFTTYTGEPVRKRRRIRTEPRRPEDAAGQQVARDCSNDRAGLVYHWIQEGRWPKHCFEPDEGTTALFRMNRLMMSFPALLVQRSDVDARPGVDPFFLITWHVQNLNQL